MITSYHGTMTQYAGLFFLVLVGCVEQNDALTPPLVENADLFERDVFAVVITSAARPFKAVAQIFPMNMLILADTMHWNTLRMYEDSLSRADREAVSDFRRRNVDSGSVQVPLRLDIPYRWITDQELREAAENPYRSVRPVKGFIVGLSHVGFSRDYRHALVYVVHERGALCDAGDFMLLERDATSVWHIVREMNVWVS
jgi:hypothetical protein